MRILGVLLAGGQSRRMGGEDKSLALLGGRPLIAHALGALAPQLLREKRGPAALVINANGDPARFSAFGLPVIPDDIAGFAGPLAGVIATLDFCARTCCDITHVLTLPADTPFAPDNLAARLRDALNAGGAQIAVACSGGRDHPVIALWSVALAKDLRHALSVEGLASVSRAQTHFNVARANWPDTPYDPFFNVNTRAAMAEAEAILPHVSRPV